MSLITSQRHIRMRIAALLLTIATSFGAEPGAAMSDLAEQCAAPDAEVPGQAAAAASTPYRPPNDWAALCFYQDQNERARQGQRPDVVFMGDSITQHWITVDPGFFTAGRIDRGISAQTSAQMLLRFYPDAISLRPRVIHLMAGTNDVAGNMGAMGVEAYQANITAMADLAQFNGVIMVLGAIPPADRFPWRANIAPVEQIRSLNNWLRAFANERGLIFIDYHAALATSSGAARDGLTRDGVHPNLAGYRIMAEVAGPALTLAIARSHALTSSQ